MMLQKRSTTTARAARKRHPKVARTRGGSSATLVMLEAFVLLAPQLPSSLLPNVNTATHVGMSTTYERI